MNLKLIMLIALQAITGLLYAQNNSFELTGKIKEFEEGETVSLIYRTIKTTDVISTAVVKDGSFTLRGSVSTPMLVRLSSSKGGFIPLFIENTKMSVVADSLSLADIKGGKANDEFKILNKELGDKIVEMRKVGPMLEKAYADNNKDEIEVLLKRIEELGEEHIEIARNYAIENPNSFVGPAVILTTDVYDLDPAVYQPIYANFSDEVKRSIAAQTIKERVDATLMLDVGSKAPELVSLTPEGTSMSLTEILKKGKLTLVDFWASWCGPCRRESAKILELYKKYNREEFNVLGVSLDTDAEKWKEAIDVDQVNWYHISDLKSSSELAAAYGVIKIPATYLIDKNGRVIAKNAEIEEIAAILEKELK